MLLLSTSGSLPFWPRTNTQLQALTTIKSQRKFQMESSRARSEDLFSKYKWSAIQAATNTTPFARTLRREKGLPLPKMAGIFLLYKNKFQGQALTRQCQLFQRSEALSPRNNRRQIRRNWSCPILLFTKWIMSLQGKRPVQLWCWGRIE